jgi:PAS domain S-box-containing protein
VWDRYRIAILASASVGLVQSGLIVGLLFMRAKRHRAERLVEESEKRFRLLADTAPVLIWVAGDDGRCTDFNRAWLNFTGRTLAEEVGDGWTTAVHPEDLEQCLGTYKDAFNRREPFDMQYRLRRRDGEYRWLEDVGVPRFAPDRTFLGYTGCAVDVTDQKDAKEALSNLSRRLIQAHETERTRVARELHDDISQRLAILITQFDSLTDQLPIAGTAKVMLAVLSEKWRALLADIGALSHQLHSSRLDYLGLPVAARALCRELSDQHGVAICFQHDRVPEDLSHDTSLALFRVLQEALMNAIKHSGARTIDVLLRGTGGMLDLAVADDGCGFDPEDPRIYKGLGLVSMRERLNLVKAEMVVRSRPGDGTTVHARIRMSSHAHPGIIPVAESTLRRDAV